MKQGIFEVRSNETLLPGLHRLRLRGDCSAVQRPGQFVNVQLDGLFLRRPFSVCGVQGDTLTVVVRRVGRALRGTRVVQRAADGTRLAVTKRGRQHARLLVVESAAQLPRRGGKLLHIAPRLQIDRKRVIRRRLPL